MILSPLPVTPTLTSDMPRFQRSLPVRCSGVAQLLISPSVNEPAGAAAAGGVPWWYRFGMAAPAYTIQHEFDLAQVCSPQSIAETLGIFPAPI